MSEYNPPQREVLIPISELIEWFESERREINREQEKLEKMRQTALLLKRDISSNYDAILFRIIGRKDTLNGISAFIIAKTAKDTIE